MQRHLKSNNVPWEDYQRLPDLDAEGQRILLKIFTHPHAPTFNNQSGHFLTKDDQQRLAKLELAENQKIANPQIESADIKQFIEPFIKLFIDQCRINVPFYRDYDESLFESPVEFCKLPTISRADLNHDITKFVPDHLPIDNLIAFTTSGTTGHSLIIPSHAEVAAKYSWYHKKSLMWNGVDTENFKSDVAVMLAGYQQKCFTYVSLMPALNNKGLIKTNFHINDWRNEKDRSLYVDGMTPDLITGDPLSLYELTQLDFQHKPQAVLSTSMALLDQQKKILEEIFSCPVINIYSMNEAGPIATSVKNTKGLRLLQPDMIVEILDADGNSMAPGERGEIVITRGINHYLPLLRYRTGDYASLKQLNDGHWYLFDLEGRPPVKFKTENGDWLNNVDITHALNHFALPQFTLHQFSNGDIKMLIRGNMQTDALMVTLKNTFGHSIGINIQTNQHFVDKVIQYTSDF